jgi:hypothetical protein
MKILNLLWTQKWKKSLINMTWFFGCAVIIINDFWGSWGKTTEKKRFSIYSFSHRVHDISEVICWLHKPSLRFNILTTLARCKFKIRYSIITWKKKEKQKLIKNSSFSCIEVKFGIKVSTNCNSLMLRHEGYVNV